MSLRWANMSKGTFIRCRQYFQSTPRIHYISETGVVTAEIFNYMAPQIIYGCDGSVMATSKLGTQTDSNSVTASETNHQSTE